MKGIIIDIDGVACDHAGPICSWVNEEFGLDATPDSVTSWDHNFGPITFKGAVKVCYPKYDFIQSMEVATGFKDFYHAIRMNAEITFATARQHSEKATRDWIENHFPGENVIFTPRKSQLQGYDYVIDDHYEECLSCAEQGMMSFLLKQPWNNTPEVMGIISQNDRVIHCPSFDRVLNLIT